MSTSSIEKVLINHQVCERLKIHDCNLRQKNRRILAIAKRSWRYGLSRAFIFASRGRRRGWSAVERSAGGKWMQSKLGIRAAGRERA